MADSRKLLGGAAISASLLAGVIAGVRFGNADSSGATTQLTSAAVGAAVGEGEEGLRFDRGPFHHLGLEAAAEALGMTVEELRDALGPDVSIADVAAELGVDVQTVIDAMVAAATTEIDQAVADGELDAARAEEIKANLPDRVTAVVNGERPPGGSRGRGHHGEFRHLGLDAAAEALGMTVEELRDALGPDVSIADVAAELGVDVQTVIDAMVATATAEIDDRVADGDLAADRAEEIKEDLAERVTAVVNGERPRGGGHGHGFARVGLDAAAEALGMTVEELRDALGPDVSIADVAAERGVDAQAVIDAMVAATTAEIDDRVADGDLAADRAEEIKEDLAERITDLVNGEPPGHGPGGPGGPRGPFGGGG